ncbi:5728_t:CDS:1 [Ambispora leptoticha]|uniref:5728_t:CDS:1 n=1 Tax=Ambispora leptoticha TaxID=144679 RepID=A0A9N9C7T5_9GLOM|nr:5728_t:CDS:1 [Ambispora leptoticha]
MWSSQKRNNEWSSLNQQIDWRSIWLYFNHNYKPTYNLTNFKLNQLKSFKIKTLLNELPTYSLHHTLYLKFFHSNKCFHCNSLDSPSHWRTCVNSSLLYQLILSTITNYLHLVELDISKNELENLIQKIYKHEAFYNIAPQPYSYYIEPTLKGLIPRSLIQTIQDYNIPYKTASNIIIKNLLLKINE